MITVKVDLSRLDLSKTIQSIQTATDTVMRTVATSMLGEVKTRIHEEGKAADGSDIGQYDTTHPLYVNPKNSPKSFPTKGKTGKTRFKNGRQHATGYFDSYKSFRDEIGRPTDRVNLSLSGQMNNQFVVIATDKGYGLGWNNEEMPERAEGLAKKYGKEIWALSETEQSKAIEVAQDTINKLL
jgi:arylsulfatase A-like enzyme